MNKNLICRKFFFLVFILSVVYPVSAQQNSSKITVVIAGYGIIGQDFNSNEEARFNRALERTLGKPEFYHFMELAAIESVDLNRIRREIGQDNSTPDQRFHYTVYGDITINSDIYSIRTVLINNKNDLIRPWFDDDLFNISKAISTVEDHGKKIAKFLEIIQLNVTKGSIRSSMADEDYEVALERLEAYRFKVGDSIELQNLEREIRRGLSGQAPLPPNRVRKFDTGGIELAFVKPLLWREWAKSESILDYYPDISGVSLTWFIPSSDSVRVFDQPYVKFSYWGFNNNAVEKALYLEEAAIHVLTLSGGYQFTWMFKRYFYPYLFMGAGYRHSIEYARDRNAEAFLHFGALLYEAGLGFKIHIPEANLMLSTNMGFELSTGEPMSAGINFSFGLAYLFHGSKRVF